MWGLWAIQRNFYQQQRKSFQIHGVWKGTFFPIQLQRSSNVMSVKKVIDVESDKHGENLLECVIDFVTKNI